MANYKESTVTGTSWQRTGQIVISNPVGGIPTVYYNEEVAVNLGDRVITSPCGNLSVTCDDMNKTINLLDPETGLETGQTMTIGQLYQAIYSHYIAEAQARDAAAVTPPVTPTL